MKKKHLYKTCECAVFIALALALMPIEIPGPAFGGDIDLVMIPLFIIAYRNGAGYGIASGLIFGLIKCAIGGGMGWGLPSVLMDYILAYGTVGIAGFFKEKSWAIEISTILGCLARYAVHIIAGITIWRIVAPTEIAGMTIANPLWYSIVYNAYMIPNTIIATIAMSMLRFPLKKMKKI